MGTQVSKPVRTEDIRKTDRIVAVVSKPGAGKSTFINSVVNQKMVPFGRRKETREIQQVLHWLQINDGRQRVILAEIPGYNSETPELEKKLKAWIAKLSSKALTLSGIVCVQRLTDDLLPSSELRLMEKVCTELGMSFPSRIVLATIMWDGLQMGSTITHEERIQKSWGESPWAQSRPRPQVIRFDTSRFDGAVEILTTLLQELDVEDTMDTSEENEETREQKAVELLEEELKKARKREEIQRKERWELERQARYELEGEVDEVRERARREREKRMLSEDEKRGLQKVNQKLERQLKEVKEELEETVEVANEREGFMLEEQNVLRKGIKYALLEDLREVEAREKEERNQVKELEEYLEKIRERKEHTRQTWEMENYLDWEHEKPMSSEDGDKGDILNGGRDRRDGDAGGEEGEEPVDDEAKGSDDGDIADEGVNKGDDSGRGLDEKKIGQPTGDVRNGHHVRDAGTNGDNGNEDGGEKIDEPEGNNRGGEGRRDLGDKRDNRSEGIERGQRDSNVGDIHGERLGDGGDGKNGNEFEQEARDSNIKIDIRDEGDDRSSGSRRKIGDEEDERGEGIEGGQREEPDDMSQNSNHEEEGEGGDERSNNEDTIDSDVEDEGIDRASELSRQLGDKGDERGEEIEGGQRNEVDMSQGSNQGEGSKDDDERSSTESEEARDGNIGSDVRDERSDGGNKSRRELGGEGDEGIEGRQSDRADTSQSSNHGDGSRDDDEKSSIGSEQDARDGNIGGNVRDEGADKSIDYSRRGSLGEKQDERREEIEGTQKDEADVSHGGNHREAAPFIATFAPLNEPEGDDRGSQVGSDFKDEGADKAVDMERNPRDEREERDQKLKGGEGNEVDVGRGGNEHGGSVDEMLGVTGGVEDKGHHDGHRNNLSEGSKGKESSDFRGGDRGQG